MARCAVESLKDYFSSYGEIVEVSVKVDPITKRRRGFGFLTFKDRDSADRVLADKERGHVVDGKTVGVALGWGCAAHGCGIVLGVWHWWLTQFAFHPKVDPKIAVPDDVSQRGGRGSSGGGQDAKKTNKVFVGGVPHDMDEETISKYFEAFGEASVVWGCELLWWV